MVDRPSRAGKNGATPGRPPAGPAAGGGKRSANAGIWESFKDSARGVTDKIRRFSLVQLWGLWLLALALFVWILVRDWLT